MVSEKVQKIIYYINANPTMSNITIAEHFKCHPNNISNIRRRYKLAKIGSGNYQKLNNDKKSQIEKIKNFELIEEDIEKLIISKKDSEAVRFFHKYLFDKTERIDKKAAYKIVKYLIDSYNLKEAISK